MDVPGNDAGPALREYEEAALGGFRVGQRSHADGATRQGLTYRPY